METTEPINGNDLQAVAQHLIMEAPSNPEEPAEEAVEATEDTQPEIVDEVDDEDVVEASSDDYEQDDDEDVEELEPTVDEGLYRVKVDGEEREVSLDELKRGYSGQKYIQKGMNEVAEQRKEYEQLQQETSQERQMLQRMMQQMQYGNVPIVPEYPDQELKESDPFGFQMKAEEYRRAVEQRQQWEQQVNYIAERERQEKEMKHQQNLNQQAARLSEFMPEFRDETKRAELINQITSNAKKHYKLTDEQIGTVQTAEEVMILNDALKYREIVANRSKAKQKAEGARPVKAAAKRAADAGKTSMAKKIEAQMKRTGKTEDVAAYLLMKK